MGILGLIQQEKAKFFSRRLDRDKSRIAHETARLEEVRTREAELAKANAQKAQLSQDVSRLKAFNKKVQGPSKVQKFAKGLAKVMDESKARSAKRGNVFGGSGSSNKDIFGGGSSSPFGGSSKKAEPKPKKKRIVIDL